jgi:hypothetical protein
MKIKLLRMPLKFQTADGEMEITVRPCGRTGENLFAAAAAFITPGARALQRVPVTPKLRSHREVMTALLGGFELAPQRYEPESLERRVLESLLRSKAVEEIDEE